MTVADVPAASAAQPGRNHISSRALNRLVTAVAAEALGSEAATVTADLTDDRGALVVNISSPVRVVSLDRVERDRGLVARTGGSILERSARAQESVRRRVGELTGYRIARVVVQIKSVEIRRESRVR